MRLRGRADALRGRLRERAAVVRRRPRVLLPWVLVALLAAAFAVDRTFTVSCGGDPGCLSIAELRAGAPLPHPTTVLDAEGRRIAQVGGPRRTPLDTEEIPELLADAFVAVEDRRFWEHDGVDARGVARAALRNLADAGIQEGASTIPMQLVRTLWAEQLRDVGPWRRKVIEARTAPRLVRALGHERVLTLYLNAIYLGDGVYGVEEAARHYFGRSTDELDLGQIATLVGITRAPEHYEPHGHPERAQEVRNVVLSTLASEGVVDEEVATAAAARELDLLPDPPEASDGRSHLTASVFRELRGVAPELAGRPGLRVHTTIDSIVQVEAESALVAHLEAIERGRYGPRREHRSGRRAGGRRRRARPRDRGRPRLGRRAGLRPLRVRPRGPGAPPGRLAGEAFPRGDGARARRRHSRRRLGGHRPDPHRGRQLAAGRPRSGDAPPDARGARALVQPGRRPPGRGARARDALRLRRPCGHPVRDPRGALGRDRGVRRLAARGDVGVHPLRERGSARGAVSP